MAETLQQYAAQFEKYVNPGLKTSLLTQRDSILRQFEGLQQSSAVVRFAQDDHLYSLEDDWLYEKDTVRDPSVITRFHKVGRELTAARQTASPAGQTPEHAAGALVVGNKAIRCQPLRKPPGNTSRLRQLLKVTVCNPLVWGIAAAVVGAKLLIGAPSTAFGVWEHLEANRQRKQRHMMKTAVLQAAKEIDEMLEEDPKRLSIVQEWLAGASEEQSPRKFVLERLAAGK